MTDLERPHDPLGVVDMDAGGGRGIERGEPAMQCRVAGGGRLRVERAPQVGIGRRERGEPVAEGAEVERCAADEQDPPRPRADPLDGGGGFGEPAGDAVGIGGGGRIEDMMGNGGPLGGGRLRRAHVEAPVDGHGVDAHDLGVESAGQGEGERRLPRGRGARQEPAVHAQPRGNRSDAPGCISAGACYS